MFASLGLVLNLQKSALTKMSWSKNCSFGTYTPTFLFFCWPLSRAPCVFIPSKMLCRPSRIFFVLCGCYIHSIPVGRTSQNRCPQFRISHQPPNEWKERQDHECFGLYWSWPTNKWMKIASRPWLFWFVLELTSQQMDGKSTRAMSVLFCIGAG